MNNTIQYDNLIAFHPGSYIEDIIDDLNITQREFANRLGTSPKTVSQLVSGEVRLSEDLAYKLEKLSGIKFETWMNLQNSYDRKILEINDQRQSDEYMVADMIDIRYFKDHNYIEDKRYSKIEKIRILRKLLNISSLTYLLTFNPSVSYRNTGDFTEKIKVNSNIMLELALQKAREHKVKKLDKNKLKICLEEIKTMVMSTPDVFYPKLKDMLLDCGVILMGLPNLQNSRLNGASKKLKNGSVLVLVTDKNKGADIFWFSLIHELYHVLEDDFYTDIEDKEAYEKKERLADEFAGDFFIDKESYNSFISKENFSRESIIEFSEKLEIPSFILLGRLKRDRLINYAHCSDMMQKYTICIN